MKILHISDSHGFHELLNPTILLDPNYRADIIIHSGDATNYRDAYRNEPEMREFLHWFSQLPFKYKIYVAGNHDSAVEARMFRHEDFKDRGIIYLENELVEIEGIKFYGSPYTPTFGDWSFMKSRHKMYDVWQMMPEDIDVLITHGPPYGILDLTEKGSNQFERVGDKSLLHQVLKIQPKYHCFGHLHSEKNILNAGIRKVANCKTVFSNASAVLNGDFGNIHCYGNILEI